MLTKEEEAVMRAEHDAKFEKVAQAIGVPALKGVVRSIATKEELAAAYEKDRHFNGHIELSRWDRCHEWVLCLVRNTRREDIQGTHIAHPEDPKLRCWSLSDTVCVLKHVAEHHVLGKPLYGQNLLTAAQATGRLSIIHIKD